MPRWPFGLYMTLFTLMAVGSTYTSPSFASGAYCTANAEGALSVDTSRIKNAPAVEAAINQQIEELQALGKQLNSARDRVFVKTGPSLSTSEWGKLAADFHKMRLNMTRLLTEMHKSQRGKLVGLVEAYFHLTDRIIDVELMLTPYKFTLNGWQKEYSLNLDFETYTKIFPFGSSLPPGTDISYSTNKNGNPFTHLSLSKQEIFNKMVRAAAQSPELKTEKKQYFEAVKCGLSRLLIGKIKLNEALINKVGIEMNAPNDFKACLKTPADEISQMTNSDLMVRREALLRLKVQEILPEFLTDLPEDQLLFYLNSGLEGAFSTLFVYPDSLTRYLLELNIKKPIQENQIIKLSQLAQQSLDAQYAKFPFLNNLRGFWQGKEFANILSKIIDPCGLKLELADTTKIAIDEVLARSSRLEDLFFIKTLKFDLDKIPHKMTELSHEQLKKIFQQYILSRKKRAVYEALETTIYKFIVDENINIDSLIAMIQLDLDALIEAQFAKATRDGQLDQYIDKLVAQVEQNKNEIVSFQSLLISFTQEMIAASKKIALYLNPQTPPTDLPISQPALARTANIYFLQLSPDLLERAKSMIREKEFSIQKQVFKNINATAAARAEKLGINCTAGEKAKSDHLRTARAFFVPDREDTAQETAIKICHNLKVIGAVFNYSDTDLHSSTAGVLTALESAAPSKEKKEYLEEFVKRYREELANDVFAEFRLLEMVTEKKRIWPFDETIRMYQVLANYDEKTFDESKLPLQIVRNGVEQSLVTLQQHWRSIVTAQKDTDFGFFIKRTKVINLLLGENQDGNYGHYLANINGASAITAINQGNDITSLTQQEGTVFPHLINYQNRLQKELIGREDVQNQVFDEFVQNNVYISMWLIGGWAAKGVMGTFPTWTKVPAAASIMNLWASNMSKAISAHGNFFIGLLGMQIGNYFKQAYEFNTELQHIKDLNQSETLKPEGAENPLSLIEWKDYQSQKKLFVDSIENAYWGAAQSAGWMMLPVVLNRSFGFAGEKMRDIRMNRAKKTQNMSPQQLKSFLSRERFRLHHKMNLLTYAFRDLKMKPPYNLDVDELYRNMRLALSRARSDYHKQNIQRSYDEIVFSIGRDIDKLAGHPSLLEIYAKALLGPNGTVSQLARYQSEFKRVAGAP